MKVHIGQEIEKKIQERGITMAEFARRLNTVPRNAYSILKKEDLKTDQLQTISNILDYNFFQYYAEPTADLTQAAEAMAQYKLNVESISINVMLDGTNKTMDMWLNRIKAINRMISQGT